MVALVTLFSEYMKNVPVPLPYFTFSPVSGFMLIILFGIESNVQYCNIIPANHRSCRLQIENHYYYTTLFWPSYFVDIMSKLKNIFEKYTFPSYILNPIKYKLIRRIGDLLVKYQNLKHL